MASPRTIQNLVLAAAMILGFAVRLTTFRSPLLDHHSWRQADTAAIARNFVREGLNPLSPQIDRRGARDSGYVETGLELLAFAVAAVSKLAGFHTETGRLLSALAFLGSAGLLFLFLRDRFGPERALVGVSVYALAFPLQVYVERAFMNEALLLCLSFASYRAAQRHLATGARRPLLGLLLATTLIALVKLPYLIVWAGIVGLYAERDGWRTLRRVELAAILALNLVAAFFWYGRAHALAAESGLSFGMTDKLFSPEVVFSTLFLRRVTGQIRQDVLGLPAVLLLIVALVVVWRRRMRCELFGLAGFLGYVLVLARGCMIHDYYLVAVVPMAAVLVPLGLYAVAERIGRGNADRELTAVCALVALLASYALLRVIGVHSWYECPIDKVQLCQAGGSLLEPGDRLVFLGYENPDLLFCLDRRGWLLEEAAVRPERLARAWRAGGTVFVFPASRADDPAQRWLRERGKTAFRNGSFELLRLPRAE